MSMPAMSPLESTTSNCMSVDCVEGRRDLDGTCAHLAAGWSLLSI